MAYLPQRVHQLDPNQRSGARPDLATRLREGDFTGLTPLEDLSTAAVSWFKEHATGQLLAHLKPGKEAEGAADVAKVTQVTGDPAPKISTDDNDAFQACGVPDASQVKSDEQVKQEADDDEKAGGSGSVGPNVTPPTPSGGANPTPNTKGGGANRTPTPNTKGGGGATPNPSPEKDRSFTTDPKKKKKRDRGTHSPKGDRVHNAVKDRLAAEREGRQGVKHSEHFVGQERKSEVAQAKAPSYLYNRFDYPKEMQPQDWVASCVAQAAYLQDAEAMQNYLIESGLAQLGWTFMPSYSTSQQTDGGMVTVLQNARTGLLAVGLRGSSTGERGLGTAAQDWISENFTAIAMGGRSVADMYSDMAQSSKGGIDFHTFSQTIEMYQTFARMDSELGHGRINMIAGHSRGGGEVQNVLHRLQLANAYGYTFNAIMSDPVDHGESAQGLPIKNFVTNYDPVNKLGWTDNQIVINITTGGFSGRHPGGAHDIAHFTHMPMDTDADGRKTGHIKRQEYEKDEQGNYKHDEFGQLIPTEYLIGGTPDGEDKMREWAAKRLHGASVGAVRAALLLFSPIKMLMSTIHVLGKGANMAAGRNYVNTVGADFHHTMDFDPNASIHIEARDKVVGFDNLPDGVRWSDLQYSIRGAVWDAEYVLSELRQMAGEMGSVVAEPLEAIIQDTLGLTSEVVNDLFGADVYDLFQAASAVAETALTPWDDPSQTKEERVLEIYERNLRYGRSSEERAEWVEMLRKADAGRVYVSNVGEEEEEVVEELRKTPEEPNPSLVVPTSQQEAAEVGVGSKASNAATVRGSNDASQGSDGVRKTEPIVKRNLFGREHGSVVKPTRGPPTPSAGPTSANEIARQRNRERRAAELRSGTEPKVPVKQDGLLVMASGVALAEAQLLGGSAHVPTRGFNADPYDHNPHRKDGKRKHGG